MTARLEFNLRDHREAFSALRGLGAAVRRMGLDHSLIGLIKTRVSQLNGCGYCIDMHTKDARAAGETEQRLYLLSAWREASVYTPRERAALAWAEATTRLEGQPVPDVVYDVARRQFDEAALVALTLCVVEINSWNRFAISFQYSAGDYEPGSRERTADEEQAHA